MKTDYLMRFLFLCESSSSFLPSVVVRPGSASTTRADPSVRMYSIVHLWPTTLLLLPIYLWPPSCVVPFFSAPLPPPAKTRRMRKILLSNLSSPVFGRSVATMRNCHLHLLRLMAKLLSSSTSAIHCWTGPL